MGVCVSDVKKRTKKNSISDDIKNNEITLESITIFNYFKNITDSKLITENSQGLNKTVIRWAEFLKESEEELNFLKNIYLFSKVKNPKFAITDVSQDGSDYIAIFSDKIIRIVRKIWKINLGKLKRNIIMGIPNNIRWQIWYGLVKANLAESDKLDEFQITPHSYEELLKQELNDKLKEQIYKDLHRTAPNVKYFQTEVALNSLFNILKCFALYDTEVGYCQGINILAANILLISDGNEKESFVILKYLFFDLKLREFYTRGFPKLHSYIYIIKQLIKEHLVEISEKIEECLIPDEVWIFKWLQSLYSLTFDFSIGIRLWDCILIKGLEFLFNFTLGFLKYFEKKILIVEDMSEFVELFKINISNMKSQEVLLFRDKLIELSNSFVIEKQVLENIIKDYNENFCNEYYEEGSFYTNRDKDLNKTMTHPNQIESDIKKFNEINQNVLKQPDDNVICNNTNDIVRERNTDMYNFGKRYFMEGKKKFIQFDQPGSTIRLMKEPYTSKK